MTISKNVGDENACHYLYRAAVMPVDYLMPA